MNLNRFLRFAAVGLIFLIGSAVWWSWEFRLPAPEDCSRDQLFRWMALYDLADETEQTQLALMNRFEALIKNGELGGSVEIDPRYATQVDRNRRLLQDRWFQETVKEFHRREVGQRAAFVDEQIAMVDQWQAMAGDSGQDSIDVMREQLSHWITAAVPDEQNHVLQALSACFVRWVASRDLSDLSLSDREKIAEGVMEQMEADELTSDGDGFVALLQEFMPEDSVLLLKNGNLLLEAWFHSQARKYQALSEEQRNQFVTEQIAVVKTSPLVPLVMEKGANQAASVSNPIAAAMQLMQTVDGWIARAESIDQPMLTEFKLAVQRQFMQISLPWMRSN